MTQAELEALAAAHGITGLTAAQLTQAAVDAVAAYSRQRPRYLLLTLSVVADQESYNPPTSGTVTGHICLDVEPYSALDGGLWEDMAGWPPLLDAGGAGGDVLVEFHQPSQVDAYRQKIDAWGRQFGSGFTQDAPGGPVRLLPPLDEADTLAWLWTFPHADAETVPDGDADLLGEALDFCALRVAAMASGLAVLAAGGKVTLGPYSKDSGSLAGIVAGFLTRADAMEKAWISKTFTGAAAQKG